MDFSTDNGSTYLNTNFQGGVWTGAYNANTTSNSSGTTLCPLSTIATNFNWYSAQIFIEIPQSNLVVYDGLGVWNNNGTYGRVQLAGTNTGTTTVNNIRFYFTVGNISSGTISLYGISQ
jgi:hypothetical protein